MLCVMCTRHAERQGAGREILHEQPAAEAQRGEALDDAHAGGGARDVRGPELPRELRGEAPVLVGSNYRGIVQRS